MAVSTIPKPAREAYVAGDYFSSRAWRAVGRVINSGKGVFGWIDFSYPIHANSAVFNIGSINFYGISNVTYPKTVSTIAFSGNMMTFVVDLTSTHTAGTIVLMEFSDTSITLS